MFSRNRIVELSFSKDSLLTKQLNWDLTERERVERDTETILDVVSANGNVYLLTRKPDDTTAQIGIMTFKVVDLDREIVLVLNSPDERFKHVDSIARYISTDTNDKYGITLYSYTEIQRLKSLPPINEMTVDDFKKYAESAFQFRTKLDSLSKLPNPPDGLLYYAYSLSRIVLGRVGYNPMVTSEEYESFIRRFHNNPETKEIVEKLFQ